MGDYEYIRCIEADAYGRQPLAPMFPLIVGIALAVLLFAAIASASMPQDINVRDRVDLVETNHFYDSEGRLVFDQLIFYEWSPAKGRHQVQAWRLLKSPNQLPRRDYGAGDYVMRWTDGETDREVRAATFRETWTQTDPELTDREFLPKERRRDLAKP